MEKKLSKYFSHDTTAMRDRKILRLRKVLGAEGYGVYWMLIETLSNEPDFSYPLADIDLLENDFNVSKEKIEAVIKQFELFHIDKNAKFFSLSLIARMQKFLEVSERARKAVNKRWEKARKLKQLDTNVLPPYNNGNTYKRKEKEIKQNNIKERESQFITELSLYLKTYSKEMLNEFFLYWSEPNKSKTKMKFELNRTWDLSRRLKTWKNNNDKWSKGNGRDREISESELREFSESIANDSRLK